MDSPPAPPNAGRRLLIHIIDQRARDHHSRPLFSIPCSKDAADGFEEISYATFANAINRAARWISDHIGQPSVAFESLVYFGPLDLRYQIITMAAMKTGHAMFLPSPRNSAEAFDSLLESCNVQKLVTTSSPMPVVDSILSRRPMKKLIIPSLEDLIDPTPVPVVPYKKTFEEGRFDPFVTIHTSGSTGIPKAITLKHGNFCCIDAFQSLEPNEIGQRCGNRRLLSPFPQFHVAGLLYQLTIPIFVDSTVVCAPSVPLTADVVDSVHVHGNVEFSSLPPSIVVDLCKNDKYLNNLSRLKGLNYAGGPLSEATGELVAQRIPLTTNIGSTEYQATALLPKPSEDWRYFKFNETAIGLEFRLRDEEAGLYEMVWVRKPELDHLQAIFVTFPDLQEFNTKDLFSKHPSKPGLWKYVSRLDDVIVMSSGENLNPVSLEGTITSSPDVKGCVIIGQGRPHAICLIEPADPNLSYDELVEKIWPFVEKANKSTIKHGQIDRSVIFLTKPDKPLPRAGKGTIQRAAANAAYASEIDGIYRSLNDGSTTKQRIQIDLESTDTTRQSLLAYLSKQTGVSSLKIDDDLIDCGLDSIQIIGLMRAINIARSARSEPAIEAKQIYDNPTVEKLAQSLHVQAVEYDDWDSDDEAQKESWVDMDNIFDDFVARTGRPKQTARERLQSSKPGPVFQPDGGREAWLQVLGSFLVNFSNWGLVNAFGVFQAYYESTLDESALSIAFLGTLQGALLLIVGFISGPLFDAGYFGFLLITASIGTVFSLMMLSLADKYWQIMLCQGVLLGLCSGFLYIPSVAVIPVYFKRKRGLALGLALSGGSFGGIIYPIVFRRLLADSNLGFGWAVRVLGFIALATLGVAVFIMKPLGPRTRRRMFDVTAFKEIPYAAFAIGAFLIYSAILVPFFFTPSYAESDLHTSGDTAFYILAILNAGQFFGRIIPSWYTDLHPHVFGPEVMMIVAEFSAGILGFCWIAVHNLGGYIPWALIYGFASGMIANLPATVLIYLCPNLAMYGTRMGMVYACAGLGLLVSTPIAAGANSSTGGYLGAQIWTGGICFASLLFFVVAAKDARRRRLLYERGRPRKHIFSPASNKNVD